LCHGFLEDGDMINQSLAGGRMESSSPSRVESRAEDGIAKALRERKFTLVLIFVQKAPSEEKRVAVLKRVSPKVPKPGQRPRSQKS